MDYNIDIEKKISFMSGMFHTAQGDKFMDTESLSVYYLRVTLKDSEPSIWRDVLVPSNLTLEELHYVIQTVMGWDNCHLHQFIAGKVFYNDGLDSVHNFDDTEEYDRNERKYTVSDLLPEEKSSIIYEYDLGDSWTHQIVLKKILPADADVDARQPRCVQGEQACPPEDCGGVWGYTDMLQAFQHTENSEHDEIVTGFSKDFNPEHFDIDAINRVLKHLLYDDSNLD